MRLEVAIKGDLRRALAAQARAVDTGTKTAVRRTLQGIRTAVRRRIAASRFRTAGLRNAIATSIAPDRLGGRTYSRAVMPAKGGRRSPVDLVSLYEQGATARPVNGKFLAIPTGDGPLATTRGGGRAMTPSEMRAKGIETELRRTANGFVVLARQGGRLVATHILVRMVRIQKRYSLHDIVQKWLDRFPAAIAREIDRAASRKGLSDAI